MQPLVVPRDGHSLSRRQIDPDAVKVLYRLHDAGFTAYLVGGGVRDLLLGRVPKDFDLGTSAHPYQIKRLFRNCFIVGRRFRLAHVRFGTKVIEVATFRRQVAIGEPEDGPDPEPGPNPNPHDQLIRRDNTFGTAEEDAFRRDFTVNALFYDIGTFSIIDYVGGLEDLRKGVIRCIGEPDVRFREDPVRMQRAVAFAARLGFRIDQPVLDSIAVHRHELARSAPARLMDEYYKILRTGSAAKTFRQLEAVGLLEPISTVLDSGADDELWSSLERLDAYRNRYTAVPASLGNAVLLGSLIVPLGFSPGTWPAWIEGGPRPGLNLGVLPLARKDIERIQHILMFQKRLREPSKSPNARRALMMRSSFQDALTWLEIHGDAPDLLAFWREAAETSALPHPPGRSRSRRRRGRHRGPRPPKPA